MINYLTLVIAVALSAVAAFYSIIGLTAIFAAAVIPVAIMGTVLEAAKVVAASWLYRNWKTAPKAIKYYMTSAVVVLVFITSMGIFGFLSKAHLEQTLAAGDYSIELKVIDQEIQNEQRNIQNAQRSLDALDRIVNEARPDEVVQARNRQARERTQLLNSIRNSSNKIQDLNNKALPLRKESLQTEAKVGPIKYIADLIYGESDQKLHEKAVRIVILIIVFVFDPLAITLLIAANHSLKKNKRKSPLLPRWTKKARTLKEKKLRGIIEIDEDSIVRMK